MLKNKKTTNILYVCITLLVIVALISLTGIFNKDSKYYAEEFLQIITEPENLESSKYYGDIFNSEGTGQYITEEFVESLKKDYGELMTNKAFDSAVSNRFLPWDILIKEQIDYNVEVDSIDVKKMSKYEDGRVHYGYLISLRILFSNGENEAISVSGDLVMVEEESSWLVDTFRWNSDYRHLYNLLLSFNVHHLYHV